MGGRTVALARRAAVRHDAPMRLCFLLLLCGCSGRIDADGWPITGDPDTFAVALDQGAVLLSEGLWDLRSIAEYRGRKPEITVEQAGGGVQIGGDCRARASCTLTFMLEARAGAPGSVALQSGTVSLADGWAASVELALGAVTLDGDGLQGETLDGTADQLDATLGFAAAPTRVDLVAGAGTVELAVPAGSYALDLQGDVTVTGVTDDPAGPMLRVHAGTVVVTGE